MFTPAWKDYEKDLTSADPQKALKAADAFDITRKQELKASRVARDWEAGRKKDIAEQKPDFVKKYLKKEQEPFEKMARNIKDFGSLETGLQPARGYLLIKLVKQTEEKTSSGLFISSEEPKDNIADILAVGGAIRIDQKTLIEPEVAVGDRVLIKKFAGIELTVKNEPCRLCQFSDILGILE